MESGTHMSHGKIPFEMVIYDNIYKRIMIDIIMDRTFKEEFRLATTAQTYRLSFAEISAM